jgi:hypothetical protein
MAGTAKTATYRKLASWLVVYLHTQYTAVISFKLTVSSDN